MTKAWKFLSGIFVVAMAVFLAIVFSDRDSGRSNGDAELRQEAAPAIATDRAPDGHANADEKATAKSEPPPADSTNAAPPGDMTVVTQFPDVGKDFLQAVRVVPAEGGGMRVMDVDPNSLYGRLGLMTGDVVHNLDSVYLPTPEQKAQGVHPFNRPEIHLQVIRGGQPVLLKVPAEQATK